MTHKSWKNLGILCFGVLSVLFWGRKASSVAWRTKNTGFNWFLQAPYQQSECWKLKCTINYSTLFFYATLHNTRIQIQSSCWMRMRSWVQAFFVRIQAVTLSSNFFNSQMKALVPFLFSLCPYSIVWILTSYPRESVSVLSKWFRSVLRIRDILLWIRSGSADPYLWLTDPDPDPAIFVSDILDDDKNFSLSKFLDYYFLKLQHFNIVIKSHKEGTKQ